MKSFSEYYEKNGRILLNDYVGQELKKSECIVHQNDSFVSLVPFWAVYPFETSIVSRR